MSDVAAGASGRPRGRGIFAELRSRVVRLTWLMGALLSPATAWAIDLGVSLSDQLLEFTVAQSSASTSPIRVGGSFLQNDDEDFLLTFSAEVGNRYRLDATGQLRYTVGARFLGFSLDRPGDDFGALAIGGSIGLALLATTPTALMLEGYYAAPDLTGGDAKDVSHIALQLESRVVPGATAYTALRRMDVRSNQYRDVRVDNSWLIGVMIHF